MVLDHRIEHFRQLTMSNGKLVANLDAQSELYLLYFV